MNKMTFGNFVSEIQGYESDTFSADASEITREEAEEVAIRLLNQFSLNYLDGVKISVALEDVRPEED